MLLMTFKKRATIVMVSTVDSDVVVIRVDAFCELTQMQPGVSPYATTMVPYVINLEKKRVLRCQSSMRFAEREINPAGKHSRSSRVLFEFPLENPFVPLTTEGPLFDLREVCTCVRCKRSTKCAELNI